MVIDQTSQLVSVGCAHQDGGFEYLLRRPKANRGMKISRFYFLQIFALSEGVLA